MKDRYEIASQKRTNKRRYWFKDQEITPEFAKELQAMGVNKIHSQRDDDWFWDTWKERA